MGGELLFSLRDFSVRDIERVERHEAQMVGSKLWAPDEYKAGLDDFFQSFPAVGKKPEENAENKQGKNGARAYNEVSSCKLEERRDSGRWLLRKLVLRDPDGAGRCGTQQGIGKPLESLPRRGTWGGRRAVVFRRKATPFGGKGIAQIITEDISMGSA